MNINNVQLTYLLFAVFAVILVIASSIGFILKQKSGANPAPVIDNLNARINAWWIMLIVLALYIAKAKAYQQVPIFTVWEKINPRWVKRILKLGFPIGLAIFFEVSIFSTGAIVLGPLGENAIAAHQIAISVTSLLFMIPLSLAFALTIRVGLYYGEKNVAAMRQVQKVGLICATLFALATMLLIALARPHIVAIYTQDSAVIPMAMYLLWFAMAYQLMDAWQVGAAGCLRGMQDTQAPMWITFMAYWIIAFPLGVYLARYTDWGIAGVWLGLIVGLSLACVLLIARLYRNNHRLAQAQLK